MTMATRMIPTNIFFSVLRFLNVANGRSRNSMPCLLESKSSSRASRIPLGNSCSIHMCEECRDFEKGAQAVFNAEHGRDKRPCLRVSCLRGWKELILLHGPDFRDAIHKHPDLIPSMSEHNHEFRRWPHGGQSKQRTDIHNGKHHPAEIGHPDKDGWHPWNRSDRFDGKHLLDTPKIKGKGPAREGDETHA